MRLVTYRSSRHGATPQVGIVQGDRVLSAARLLGENRPLEMLELLDRGQAALTALGAAVEEFAARHREAPTLPDAVVAPRWEVELLAPLPRPRSLRDFYAFEQHVATAYRARGREVPPAWYEVPVFYFGHAGSIVGPDAPVQKPAATNQLDFELELACVIGLAGRDISAERASQHVAGYTIMNDWSARDLQRQEMSVGLGPAKGKDFATSLGPILVTPDELADCLHDGRHDLTMIARINGEDVTRGNAKAIHWTFAQLIERASQDVELLPGDVIGSGTVGGGCLLELGVAVHPWLQPGDEVELEIERLGRLRNRVVGPEG
jgi:fumarylacetoacetate (FAA) hydrolase